MEQIYNVEILTADNMTYLEKIKALNELEAVDMAYQIYKKDNIVDVKVVK